MSDNVGEAIVPSWTMIFVLSIIISIFLISLYQFCINPPTKQQFKIRIPILIAILFEIIFVLISYLSIYGLTKNHACKVLSHILLFFVLICISFIGYHLVDAPNHDTKLIKINKYWKFVSLIHLLWLISCTILFILTKRKMLYQSIYFFGFLLHIIINSMILLHICYYVRLTINQSITKQRTISEFQRESGGINIHSNHNSLGETQNGEHDNGRISNSKVLAIDPRTNLIKLAKAKKEINIMIIVVSFVIIITMMSFIWRITIFDANKYSNCTRKGRRPGRRGGVISCEFELSPAPFDELFTFLFHYIFVCILYIAINIKYWTKIRNQSQFDMTKSLYFKIFGGLYGPNALRRMGSKEIRKSVSLYNNTDLKFMHNQKLKHEQNSNKKNKGNNNTHTIDIEIGPKTNDNHNEEKHENMDDDDDDDNDDEEEKENNGRTTDFGKNGNKATITVTRELNEIDYIDAKRNITPAFKPRSPGGSLDTIDSIFPLKLNSGYGSSGELSTELDLSKTHLDTSLHHIDFNGQIIGKRGAHKAKKITKDEIDKRKKFYENHGDIKAIDEEVDDVFSMIDRDLQKDVNAAKSITVLSAKQQISEYPRHLSLHNPLSISETQRLSISKSQQMQLEMKSDRSSSFASDSNIQVIVLEFQDVLCTQAANKLKDKMDHFIEKQNKFSKELYFGGDERLEFIKIWLKNLIRSNQNIKCFLISDEQSKMIVTLLQDVDLLRNFVSVNPLNRNKLVSHIIGYDHKMSKDVGGKRHLILLKLLQFLDKKHDTMLYIGCDKQLIHHINSIQICKTYHVETKGLTRNDMEKIERKHNIKYD